jgi:DNA-binding GntR family transcriptional regulator
METNPFELGEIKNLSKLVSEKIQELIYTGVLKPGNRLVQTELAERFKVSRVAIRDALQELRQTGLVLPTSSGGMIVRPVSYDDIENLAFLRKAIEPAIAAKACSKIDSKGIEKLQQIIAKQEHLFQTGDFMGYLKEDWAFHKTFYSYENNDLALEFLEKLWSRSSQARGMIFINKEWGAAWVERSIAGHKKLLVMIARHDSKGIEQIVSDNVLSAGKEQLQWYQEVNTQKKGKSKNSVHFQ